MRVLDGGSLSSRSERLDGAVDQRSSVGLAALKTPEHQSTVGRDLSASGLGDAVGLSDEQRRLAEFSTERDRLGEHVDADREYGQRTDLAGKLDPRVATARQVS